LFTRHEGSGVAVILMRTHLTLDAVGALTFISTGSSASSFTKRSCSVWNRRSERPRASSEYAASAQGSVTHLNPTQPHVLKQQHRLGVYDLPRSDHLPGLGKRPFAHLNFLAFAAHTSGSPDMTTGAALCDEKMQPFRRRARAHIEIEHLGDLAQAVDSSKKLPMAQDRMARRRTTAS
jgi:hypothetical protein